MSGREILVLAGGLSHEREISLRSGSRVADALQDVGVDAAVADVDGALLQRLSADAPAAVFIALHGAVGEDGAIQDVLRLAGVPYVGSSATACRLAYDKPTAKAMVERTGTATPASVVLPHETFRELGASAVLEMILDELGLPLVVKPTRGGSALGMTIVRDPADLPTAMIRSFNYAPLALVEQYAAGTEVSVGVIDRGDGPAPLVPVELVPVSGDYDFTARYTAGAVDVHVPPRLPADVVEAAQTAALAAHSGLGLGALSRTDLIVDGDGRPVFLEAAVSPGMTETSVLPLALEASGESLGSACADLVQAAVGSTRREAQSG